MSVPVGSILDIVDAVLPSIMVAIRAHQQAAPNTWPTLDQVKSACQFDAQGIVTSISAWENQNPLPPSTPPV